LIKAKVILKAVMGEQNLRRNGKFYTQNDIRKSYSNPIIMELLRKDPDAFDTSMKERIEAQVVWRKKTSNWWKPMPSLYCNSDSNEDEKRISEKMNYWRKAIKNIEEAVQNKNQG